MVCKICGRACWAARPAPVPEPGEPLPEFYRRAARQFRSELAADRTLQAETERLERLAAAGERALDLAGVPDDGPNGSIPQV